MKYHQLFMIIFVICCNISNYVFAFDDTDTHPRITEKIYT
jgi:hypothetical protein